MTNTRSEFFPLQKIIEEFRQALEAGAYFDAVTLVGEGEPTLYSRIGELILAMKELTEKPVAVITNGALLYEEGLRSELSEADIVLPSLDAFDEPSFHAINRPYVGLNFERCYRGLVDFADSYAGELWLETMLIQGMNDDEESLRKLQTLIEGVKHSRLYLNTSVRPPAEEYVRPVAAQTMDKAVKLLGGISIDRLDSEGFFSSEKDDYRAILGIIGRHPMNQFEIATFLKTRQNTDTRTFFERLDRDFTVHRVEYKGFVTYRLQ